MNDMKLSNHSQQLRYGALAELAKSPAVAELAGWPMVVPGTNSGIEYQGVARWVRDDSNGEAGLAVRTHAR